MERGQDATSTDDTLDGCILLTEEQIDAMMLQLNNDTTDSDVHSRQKRTLTDFGQSPYNMWPMPITYKFDGSHCEYSAQNHECRFHFLHVGLQFPGITQAYLFLLVLVSVF